jgi:hypothetical protein
MTLPEFRMSDYCCQAPDRLIDPSSVDAEGLVIMRSGNAILRFSPLGNNPTAPIVALVGITPGSQSKEFIQFLQTCPVELAAKKAAFARGQEQIKDLLCAHGFAKQLGIDLGGDLNDNPAFWTTSLVKCCLMVDGPYKYKAQDLFANDQAAFCVCNRFIPDVARYPTLRWVIIFGDPGWKAVEQFKVGDRSVREYLENREIKVLNFPHFAQNFQQRAIFKLRAEEEGVYFERHPTHRAYALGARRMREALLSALGDSG